ncbi:RNA polymerase sigma factor SigI [Pseudobacteroides cellulosolvens]|uniref:RNA polymerase sigma factor SigI n=1 Tax=Pseudobacteroides cellulosolvens ATCC 35603 = DSM 2933 TaxID=398512 RepID=A0A0L6JNX4_9FIRM|nr:RNA polymerase sigma factor SigI [Pseudobacteroides cellulosolvens]KNY27484.1 RNA polymerase, sigma 28 subunit, SigI [Pseudobacteroides cellulosolvens ATCC 35603 = DSM 2933]
MNDNSLNERVQRIKSSDIEIDKLVEEYKPFIASCVEKITGRFVRYGEDDELSIALLAFVEAIKAFDISKGNFLSFAQNVIKRRLIDYFRKESKHSKIVSISTYTSDDEDNELDLSTGEALDKYSQDNISEYRRLELQELKKELALWDISFFELTNASPKSEKTRKSYNDIIQYLMKNPDTLDQVKKKKLLPIADIEKNTGIPRKTIERSRKYILAVIIILTGDYQYVKDYINPEVMK